MKIYFIEKTIPFDANNLNDPNIGGSEKTLINISNELGKNKSFTVKVFNNCLVNKFINNVEWINLTNHKKYDEPDYLIAMSDVNLLSYFQSKKNFLWSHSIQSFEKFIRKKQFLSFLKYKPILILEGDYHYKKRSLFTSLFGKKILKIAADNEFLDTNIDINFIPKKNVIFNTRSDRNLKIVLEAWKHIHSKVKDAILYINPPFKLNSTLIDQNVKIRNKGDKLSLVKELVNTKLMLNPGHKGEVFCLAAEEAKVMCVPIVTMGIGCLYERVENCVTGFICNNIDDFILNSISILNDDNLYLSLKSNIYKKRNLRSYKDVSFDLIKIIKNNK